MQIRVAACGRRWGKTEALSIDIASLALDGRNCRQLVVAPTDVQARLLGNEVLLRLLDAWEWRDADGRQHPSVAAREITVRQRPALSSVLVIGTGDIKRVMLLDWQRAARGFRQHTLIAGGLEDTVLGGEADPFDWSEAA